MTEYIVSWKINLDADSPQEAAQKALEIQRDPESIATVFKVVDLPTKTTTHVDLTPELDPAEEIYTVEEVEPGMFQSVFPSAQAELSQLHASAEDAWAYIKEHTDV